MSEITQQDFESLRSQLATLTKQFAHLSTENAELRRAAGETITILPPGEAPLYELAAPYYAPDDVYYPEGARFEDMTGQIVPNEVMIPLNAAAERRVKDWLSKQPSKTRTPPLELIVQAAMEMRPQEGEDQRTLIDHQTAILRRALELHAARMGAPLDEPPQMTRRPDASVPLMSNTRINGQMNRPRQSQTRMREVPVIPADKAAPPIGTQPTTNLGKAAHPGVAAR